MSQIWTGYNDVTNVTGISYKRRKAKLTRSCAHPNTGAIKYIPFTTDIALKSTEKM